VHDICSGVPKSEQVHFEAKGAGHYGIFSGRRWREHVYPVVKAFISSHHNKTAAAPVAKATPAVVAVPKAAPAAKPVAKAAPAAKVTAPAVEVVAKVAAPVKAAPKKVAKPAAAPAKPAQAATKKVAAKRPVSK
jgi:poly(3-hydroxybutyrate) depolymerase